MKRSNLKLIGLTGGIASGKSTVSCFIKSKGYAIIDADQIAREVVEKGSLGLNKIANVFGKEILNNDGTLNRRKLRGIVFKDKNALKKLEKITHPLIINKIKESIISLEKDPNIHIAFLDCPLLFEMSLEDLVDEIWLISTTIENQINRIIDRDDSSISDAKNIINQQLSLDEKASRADVVIENNSSIKSLELKLDALLKERC